MKPLQLYVWPRFAPDWSPGLAFAIAGSVDEAQRMVISELGYEPGEWGEVKAYPLTIEIAFARHGGS